MKREFKYRGKSIEELEKLPFDEMIELLPSRARRSLQRGLTEQQSKLLENIKTTKESGDKKAKVRTHVRDMVVIPEMVGVKLAVYNGKEFVEFDVTPEMIGKYISEFSMTRKIIQHSAPGVGATRSSLFVPVK